MFVGWNLLLEHVFLNLNTVRMEDLSYHFQQGLLFNPSFFLPFFFFLQQEGQLPTHHGQGTR